MRNVITLNGLDKSGKSTQANRIKDHYKLVHIVGKISRYETWPDLKDVDLFSWWFIDGETEDVIDTIYKNLQARNEEIKTLDYPLIIVDRGNLMFDAVSIATTIVREKCSVQKAKKITEKIKGKYNLEKISDIDIFYAHGNDLQDMIKISSMRTKNFGDFSEESNIIYLRYQKILANLLSNQIWTGDYKVIEAQGNEEEIFNYTKDIINKSMIHDLNFSGLDRLVGFGGMSESGKSSFGDILIKRSFIKIKIKDLINPLNTMYKDLLKFSDEGIYSISDDLLAILFLENLLKLNKSKISIESLHNYGFTKELKRVLRNKFDIVYMDAPLNLRVLRNSKDKCISYKESEDIVNRKDKMKSDRGAYKIKEIADTVIDNSSSFDYSVEQLDNYLH